MAEFTRNSDRIDPYKNFKFLVYFNDSPSKPVAGISKVGGLTRTTEPVEHRDGGDPSTMHKSPGMVKFESIMLERGVTHDETFERWANRVWNYGAAPGSAGSKESSLKNFRKDIRIVLLNEAGQPVIAYDIYRCWVSAYNAMPELDASGAAVAIQSITLEHEGWVRDTAVKEPTEPTYSGALPGA